MRLLAILLITVTVASATVDSWGGPQEPKELTEGDYVDPWTKADEEEQEGDSGEEPVTDIPGVYDTWNGPQAVKPQVQLPEDVKEVAKRAAMKGRYNRVKAGVKGGYD